MPRPPPDSPDQTLSQAASILAKAKHKRAPVPPKRTSSFKDTQMHGTVSPSIPPLPETLIEMENNPDFYSLEHTPEELEALDSVDKEFQFLNDNNKMMSSSDEKLSTPASQSRSGSLDRVPGRSGLVDCSPRSSSRERSLDDSPGKSGSPLKTPDTDLSGDSSAALPPPPPEVVFPPPPPPEELELELEPIHPPPSPSSKKQQIRQQVFPKGPVPMLRASLRKTKPNTDRDKDESARSESGDSLRNTKTIGSLEENNVKQVISQYGTIPKGARIGAFLASLEQNSQHTQKDSSGGVVSGNAVAALHSPSTDHEFVHKEGSRSLQPTPEVTRKVEEWRRGVEVSMKPGDAGDADEEHNVRPSSIFRSSSIHAMPGSEDAPDPGGGGSAAPLTANIKRQKSDLSKANKEDKTRRNSDNRLLLQNMGIKENMDAPIPEWKRQIQKPTASPRVGQRSLKLSRTEASEQTSQDASVKKDIFKSAAMLPPFHLKKTTTENASAEHKTDKNTNTDTVEYPVHESLVRKFSPPVPKKPVAQQPVCDGKKDVGVGGEMTKSTDSSQDDNADAVIDTVPLGKLNKSLWERDKRSSTDKKQKDKDKSGKKDKKGDKKEKKENKPASPSPGEKEKGRSKFSFLRGSHQHETNSKTSSPTQETAGGVGKHLPPGAQPVLPGAGLPGARQVLPTGSGAASSAQPSLKVQPTSVQLNKVDKEERSSNTDSEPISKEKLKTLSKNLTSSLASLNLNKTKHTSNFLHLSEEVQSFYTACFSYVESLPPHGKFQFRELLTNLQAIAESLKTCSGGNAREYDKLLSRLQNSIRDINAVLAR